MDELIVVPLVTLAIVIVIISCIFGLICGVDYADCRGFESGTGIKTKWSFGCYAEIDGKWVPKQYAFGEANEVRIK